MSAPDAGAPPAGAAPIVVRVVCGVVRASVPDGADGAGHAPRVLVTRRGPGMSHAGAWEFPGGKVEHGESDAAALARELHEELGLRVTVGPLLGAADTPVGGRTVRLVAYACTSGDTPELREHDALAWVEADGLGTLDWAPADVPLLGAVAGWLRGGAPPLRPPGPGRPPRSGRSPR